MITRNLLLVIVVSLATLFKSCKETPKGEPKSETAAVEETQSINNVMSTEKQAALTPEMVLQDFMDGNARFQAGNVTRRKTHRTN
jgi:carbonic anhydrase